MAIVGLCFLLLALIESVSAVVHDRRVLSAAESRSYLFHDVFTNFYGASGADHQYKTEPYATVEDGSLRIRLFASRVHRVFLRVFDEAFRGIFSGYAADSFRDVRQINAEETIVGDAVQAVYMFYIISYHLGHSASPSTSVYFTSAVHKRTLLSSELDIPFNEPGPEIWATLDYGLIATVNSFSHVIPASEYSKWWGHMDESRLFPIHVTNLLRRESKGAKVVYDHHIMSTEHLQVCAKLCDTLAEVRSPSWVDVMWGGLQRKMEFGYFARFDAEAVAWAAERRLGAADTVHFVTGLARAFRAGDLERPFVIELCAYVTALA